MWLQMILFLPSCCISDLYLAWLISRGVGSISWSATYYHLWSQTVCPYLDLQIVARFDPKPCALYVTGPKCDHEISYKYLHADDKIHMSLRCDDKIWINSIKYPQRDLAMLVIQLVQGIIAVTVTRVKSLIYIFRLTVSLRRHWRLPKR